MTKQTAFTRWLDTLVEEKGYDPETLFEVEGESGTNWMPLEVVLDAIKATSPREQKAIQTVLVRLDFLNQDCLGYFKHLAQALAI